MGKYMKKAKINGDIAVMEVSQSSSLGLGGVRTRAKTLALQRLHQAADKNHHHPESSYLQLRNRRLEKRSQQKQSPAAVADRRGSCGGNPNSISERYSKGRASSRLGVSSVKSGSIGSVSIGFSEKGDGLFGNFAEVGRKGDEAEEKVDLGVEGSFGENNFEIENRERSTRESTPCSFIRDSDTIGTPGSTTGPVSSIDANRRTRNAHQRNIPTTNELEEFFACAEQQQRRLFIEKYNFDIVNDLPLPGRYEWVRV